VVCVSFSFCIPMLRALTHATVRVEESFSKSDFEPDVFASSEIEKEWKPDADRASIYKAAVPELLRDGGPSATGIV